MRGRYGTCHFYEVSNQFSLDSHADKTDPASLCLSIILMLVIPWSVY